MKWINILKIIAPAILAVIPGAQPFIPLIIAGMEVAEETQKPGVEKKAIAIEAVKLGADTANTIAKKEVIDPSLAVKTAESSIDLIVDISNKLHDKTGDDK